MSLRPWAAVRLLDAGACRLPLAFLAALAAWAAMLIGLQRTMRAPPPVAPAPRFMSAQLVEIAPLPADDPRAAARSPQPQIQAQTQTQARPQASDPPAPPPPRPEQPVDTAPSHPVQPLRAKPERHARRPAPAPASKPAPLAAPAAPTPAPSPAAPAGNQGVAQDSSARPLSQPLPTLPDDLRANSLQAVALARLLIHADGSVEVTLIKPAPNPRLNQLLLQALRKWRFYPAMKDGKAIESSQDIRVHFKVD